MKAAAKAQKSDYSIPARQIYAAALNAARQPVFYRDMGVPDSFDGRFEMLVLHVFFVIHRMIPEGEAGQRLNQALFDAMFADIDQTLREMGIGDMGVPKHMRKMMKAFNGRMHAYRSEIDDLGRLREEVLHRNVYGTAESVAPRALQALQEYGAAAVKHLAQTPSTAFFEGRMSFKGI